VVALACAVLLCPLAAANAPPALEIAVSAEGLSISGDTASEAHEMVLRRTLALRAPALPTDIDWQRSAELPNGWSLVTEFAVRIATLLELGEVIVSNTRLTVSGTSAAPERLQETLARLEPLLLPGMAIDSQVLTVSDERESFARLCERQLLAVGADYRIEFARESAVLNSASEPALHRLVEVLADCPELNIALIGYTDSEEDQRGQQSLRRERAAAVGDALSSRGIDRQRLLILSGTLDTGVPAGLPRRSKRRVEFVTDP